MVGIRDLGTDQGALIKGALVSELGSRDPSMVTVVHAGATGLDQVVAATAKELGTRSQAFLANWKPSVRRHLPLPKPGDRPSRQCCTNREIAQSRQYSDRHNIARTRKAFAQPDP